MGTFGTVLLVILFFVLFIGILFGGGAAVFWAIEKFSRPLFPVVGIVVAGLLAFAIAITVAINSGVFEGNNAEHCGPGTRYVSDSYYNPATKTTITEWMCVV